MAKSELVLMEDAKNCTLYTIQFLSADETEFEKFYKKFVDSKEFNADLMRIVSFIDRIADFGALERFFRPEGKINDNVVALPVVSSKLRLYCLRLSDKILIIGNGGNKKVGKYQEDKELNGYVVTLQKFDKLIKEGIKSGAIEVTENKIITNKIFEI
ncbi:MAG: hypothetical protein IJ681_10755 [Bacteroidales bacterium]|nr:hypothetical protein [Bacteroidales bacterium]